MHGLHEKDENQKCTLARYVHKLRMITNASSNTVTNHEKRITEYQKKSNP